MKKIKAGLLAIILSCSVMTPPAQAASDPFIGEIMWVSYTFCPRGWAEANGQILQISQNTALFALLGTTYGGDGRVTFALPDLRGRVSLHTGSGPGLSSYALGQKGGTEQVTLSSGEMPAHSHAVNASEDRSSKNANGSVLGSGGRVYDAPINASTQLAATAIADSGNDQPHENRPPYLALRACIALAGIFPPRN